MTLTTTRYPRTNKVLLVNECQNPSFGVNANLWGSIGGYGGGGAGTDRLPTTINWSPYGTGALQKQWTTAPTSGGVNGVVGLRHTFASPGVGIMRTFSARAILSWTAQVMARMNFINSSGGLISSVSGTPVDTGPNTWARPSVSAAAPAGTVTINMEVVVWGSGTVPATALMTLQTAMVTTTGYLADYFDGDTYSAGNGTQSTVWTGSAGASQSQLRDWDPGDVITPQLVIGYDVAQQSRNIVHQLADGPVAATLYPASNRQGTLKLFFLDAASADTARSGYAAATAWDYLDTDQPQEGMRFVVDGQVRKYQDDRRLRWTVEVPYKEIG